MIGPAWAAEPEDGANRIEITASLPGALPGEELYAAILRAIQRGGYGATVSRAIGFWGGTMEHATRVELCEAKHGSLEWQVQGIVGAAIQAGCTAVQVERFSCRIEEQRDR